MSFQPPEEMALELVPRPKKSRTDTVRGYLPTVETFTYAMRVKGRPGAGVRRGFSIWVVEPRARPEMVVVSVDLDFITHQSPKSVQRLSDLWGDLSEQLDVLRRDISPTVSEVLRIRTHTWLTGLLAKDIELLAWRVHQQSFD